MTSHEQEHIHIELVSDERNKVRFEFENAMMFFDLGQHGFDEYKCRFLGQFYGVLSRFRRDVIQPPNARGKVRAQISKSIELEMIKVDGDGIIEMTFVVKDSHFKGHLMDATFFFDLDEMECIFEKVGQMYAEAHKEYSWQSGVRIQAWEKKMEDDGMDGDVELERFDKKE